MRSKLATVALASALAVAGCAHHPGTVAHADVPSSAAKLVCTADAVGDITTNLGVGVTAPMAPTWSNHVYSCRYVFAAGVMVLSVEDHPDATAATTAFASGEPSGATVVPGLGQQAYARADGSAVILKDSSILTVDVSGLPAMFGVPPHPRNIDALTVADAVLTCWTQDQ
jgi:hypothetical protein